MADTSISGIANDRIYTRDWSEYMTRETLAKTTNQFVFG